VICGKAVAIPYGALDGPTQNKRHGKKEGWVETPNLPAPSLYFPFIFCY
jgi:hypothetical protein